MTDAFTWIGILFCLSQSAIFSGLNLAYFSISRLQLEARVDSGDKAAVKVMKLRSDANFLLCTILWGNVSVNVLLALLSDSVLTGAGAFIFSTVGITIFGEIVPQAYFSRHALRVASFFSPLVRFYQLLFFLLAKPTALLLDRLVGPEGATYFREKEIEALLEKHILEHNSEIGKEEGIGALNFLNLDDLLVSDEGREITPERIFVMEFNDGIPILPSDAVMVEELYQSFGKLDAKWAIITDAKEEVILALDTERFLRDRALKGEVADLIEYCHPPVLARKRDGKLGSYLHKLVVEADHHNDRVVDLDCIIYWPEIGPRRIITSKDILGRLLHGIVKRNIVEN